MVIKTFNVNEETYEKFSKFCKSFGLSMSKQVDLFMKSQIEDDPKVRKEYIERLRSISKGKFHELGGESLLTRYD